jgi:hypothetical protein
MTNQVNSAEYELRVLLDRWAEGIADHRPADVAELFTEDALFQGFDPAPGFGRAYIAGYYAKQPLGLTADYDLLSAVELAPGVLSAYARVQFTRPEGSVPVYLTVIAQRGRSAWEISHYHVSKRVDLEDQRHPDEHEPFADALQQPAALSE